MVLSDKNVIRKLLSKFKVFCCVVLNASMPIRLSLSITISEIVAEKFLKNLSTGELVTGERGKKESRKKEKVEERRNSLREREEGKLEEKKRQKKIRRVRGKIIFLKTWQ